MGTWEGKNSRKEGPPTGNSNASGEASADVHRLARGCADEIAGKRLNDWTVPIDLIGWLTLYISP